MAQKEMIYIYGLKKKKILHINDFLAVSIPVIYNAIILDVPSHFLSGTLCYTPNPLTVFFQHCLLENLQHLCESSAIIIWIAEWYMC